MRDPSAIISYLMCQMFYRVLIVYVYEIGKIDASTAHKLFVTNYGLKEDSLNDANDSGGCTFEL